LPTELEQLQESMRLQREAALRVEEESLVEEEAIEGGAEGGENAGITVVSILRLTVRDINKVYVYYIFILVM
jgi:hypothetical protein